ncbi:MAG: hypothetical protein MK008_12360 [Bdellovibrionales bacterium]|nr:hypothetical protein [Bdellovibrionales bacterium]
MKTISLIIISLFLVVSFQNCAQDPYQAADGQASKSSSPNDFFDEDVDIIDDIGSGDNINLPDPNDNTGGSSTQLSQEFYNSILKIRSMPLEKTKDSRYLATPMEFLLMSDDELERLSLDFQELNEDSVVKDIRITFKFNDLNSLNTEVSYSKDGNTRGAAIFKTPPTASKSLISAFKNVALCEYTIQTDKPMCEQVVTDPNITKYFHDGRYYQIGYKEDACPRRYYDVCPSSEPLYQSLLNYIGSNYESWKQ